MIIIFPFLSAADDLGIFDLLDFSLPTYIYLPILIFGPFIFAGELEASINLVFL